MDQIGEAYQDLLSQPLAGQNMMQQNNNNSSLMFTVDGSIDYTLNGQATLLDGISYYLQLSTFLDTNRPMQSSESQRKQIKKQESQDSINPLQKKKSKHKFRQSLLPSISTHQCKPSSNSIFILAPSNQFHERSTSSVSRLPIIQPYSNNNAMFFKISRYGNKQEEDFDKDENDKKYEKELITQLENSFEMEYEDAKVKPLTGKNAVKDYFTNYKQLKKVSEQNEFKSLKGSAQTSMLLRSEDIFGLPCRIGLIKSQGDESRVHLKNQKYGDKYTKILSEGLKQSTNVKDFWLSNNRIKESGATELLTAIGKNARAIDLKQNLIGRLGVDAICRAVTPKDCKIEILNVEDNKLGDKNILRMLKAIQKNTTLKRLNISKNFLTNEIAKDLAQIISTKDTFEELYIHWNQIKGDGALVIIEALLENDTMNVLDLSWNAFGQGNPQVVSKLCDYLIKNKSLVHLDLSSNFFTLQDCKSIAEAIKQNHTIYGFHFRGNYGWVDARGFLIVDSDEFDQVTETTRIESVSQVSYNGGIGKEKLLWKNPCWICDGWAEQQFKWTPGESGDVDPDPLFVHLQFESYKNVYISKKQQNQVNLMIPPNQTRYFYTVNDNQTNAQDQTSIDTLNLIIKEVPFLDKMIDISIDKLNITNKPKRNEVLNESNYQPKISVIPRTPDPIYIPPKMKKAKRIWTFPISIWAKDFKFETEEFLRKCFEKDWSCAKIAKVVKNPEELQQVKDYLWTQYKPIKETYKFYASYNPNGDIWSISSNPITEFAQVTDLVDGKTLKLSDLDLKFIATCSASIEYKGNPRNPERALCRYQFMEFLARVSEDKFLKQKSANNMLESCQMLMEQCRPVMSQYDQQKWRNERYFNEECDDVCKYFKSLVMYVYQKNSNKKVKPGQKSFMCLDELQDICNRAGFFDENFVDRDANMAFNLSMMMQIDELESDRIFQMSFIEFLEALARIAEKISPTPLDPQYADYNYEQRQALPLHLKLEKLMVILAQNLGNEDHKNNFGKMSTSLFGKPDEEDD